MKIPQHRRAHLYDAATRIFDGIPPATGKQEKTQIMVNRIEAVSANEYEFKLLTEMILKMMRDAAGKEVLIAYQPKVLSSKPITFTKNEFVSFLRKKGLELNNQLTPQGMQPIKESRIEAPRPEHLSAFRQ